MSIPRVQIVPGIAGVALPSATRRIVWSRAMRIEAFTLYSQDGDPHVTAQLALEIVDEDTRELFSSGTGASANVGGLLAVGKGADTFFSAPRWFPLGREVSPGDAWLVTVTGPAAAVPWVAWRTRARDEDFFRSGEVSR